VTLSCSRGLISSALGLSEVRETDEIDQLCHYTELLERWSKVHRLVGWRKASLLATEGLADAWSLAELVALQPDSQLVDLGSGAGLPGIVLAIARPTHEIHLVEPRRKRANFLREVRRELQLNKVKIHHGREEDVRGTLSVADHVMLMGRAFRAPEELLRCALSWNADSCIVSLRSGRPLNHEGWLGSAEVDGRPRGRTSHKMLVPARSGE